jgi:hypothetical protein
MSERQTRSAGRSCDTIASFLIKTYEILEVNLVYNLSILNFNI